MPTYEEATQNDCIKFDMQCKGRSFLFNSQLLKQQLCSASILALPEGSENFVVYCDASRKGLGAVLMQMEKRVAATRLNGKVDETILEGSSIKTWCAILVIPNGTDNQEKDEKQSQNDKTGLGMEEL
ncbi:putative reverse transcriptase domain-containing protein [Tanacetum coccineum]